MEGGGAVLRLDPPPTPPLLPPPLADPAKFWKLCRGELPLPGLGKLFRLLGDGLPASLLFATELDIDVSNGENGVVGTGA